MVCAKKDFNNDPVPNFKAKQYFEMAKSMIAGSLALTVPKKYAEQVCIEGTPEANETVARVQEVLVGEFDKATEGHEYLDRRQLRTFFAGVMDRCSEIIKEGL